jgi:shikimate dehydrogenase
LSDKYAVLGNPIAHSKSPQIHAEFARQTGQYITFEAILAPVDGGFENFVSNLRLQGYKGVNITVPFKFEALLFIVKNNGLLNLLAAKARAVNTITFNNDGSITGDNTDGIGLVNDITKNLKFDITNKKILLLGSG